MSRKARTGKRKSRGDSSGTRHPPAPRMLLERAGLSPGQSVLDIGCGGAGAFTLPAAELVADGGSVTGLDVDPAAVAELGARPIPESLQVKACGVAEFPINDGSFDFGIIGYTLHEIRSAGEFLAEVNRVLRLDGRLLVVDWRKVDDGCQPPKKQRLARGDAQAILERAGFEVEEAAFLDDSTYLVVAVKDRTVETVNLYGER